MKPNEMTAKITFEQQGKETLIMTVTSKPTGETNVKIHAEDEDCDAFEVSGLHAALLIRLFETFGI